MHSESTRLNTGTTVESVSESPSRRRLFLIIAASEILVGAVIIYWFQSTAPESDHQNANLVSFAVSAVTVLTVIALLHLVSAQAGHRLRVPIFTAFALGILAIVFRYDGFSGEMMPQFKYRFGKELQRQSLDVNVTKSDLSVSPTETTEFGSDSLGLLGTDRTGVIADRQFAIPSAATQVKTLWSQGIGEGWSSFAISAGRAVTIEQRDDLECVTCYRLSDGELLWNINHQARHEHPYGGIGPRSTPSISENRVYAQGATGRVWCIALDSGELIWTVDLLEHAGWDQTASEAQLTWGRSGSPLIVDGLCVVPYGGPDSIEDSGRTLIAFDQKTGEVRWTVGKDQPSYASPDLVTLAGVRQIVSVNEKTITGHNVQDGTILWDFSWPGGSNGAANCAKIVQAGDDQFLIGKGYGGGSTLVKIQHTGNGKWTADSVWELTRVLKTKFTHSVVDGDVAYAISNGSLEAVLIADGKRLWSQPRRSRFGQGQILIVGDTIVAQSESGDVVLVAVDRNEYRELLRIPALSSKTWNIPTVAGRYLLVRNDRQAICFELPRLP